MWADSEERQNKKINRIARNGAYAVGGGVGLWFMNSLYPYEPGAEKIASMFGDLAVILLAYGLLILTIIMFKRKFAFATNLILVWLALPAILFLIFSHFWTGR